jgi:hypothetical protein
MYRRPAIFAGLYAEVPFDPQSANRFSKQRAEAEARLIW